MATRGCPFYFTVQPKSCTVMMANLGLKTFSTLEEDVTRTARSGTIWKCRFWRLLKHSLSGVRVDFSREWSGWKIRGSYRQWEGAGTLGNHLVYMVGAAISLGILGFSAKDSSNFLQVPWERGSVEQGLFGWQCRGCKQPSLGAACLAEACSGADRVVFRLGLGYLAGACSGANETGSI